MGEIGEHHRDIKAHRKRQNNGKDLRGNPKKKRVDEPPRRRCWDWMIVSGSCHYAKNRSSFKEYRRLGKNVSSGFIQGHALFVAGVGTVELKVQAELEEGSPVRKLLLENVLHVPEARCNGFSVAVYHTIHGGAAGLGRKPEGFDEDGNPLWCSEEFKGLGRLVLAGNPQGESYLDDGPNMLSMYIGDEDWDEIISAKA